jgi:hypothetical protein
MTQKKESCLQKETKVAHESDEWARMPMKTAKSVNHEIREIQENKEPEEDIYTPRNTLITGMRLWFFQ